MLYTYFLCRVEYNYIEIEIFLGDLYSPPLGEVNTNGFLSIF